MRGRLERYCAIADDLVRSFLLGRPKDYYDGFVLATVGKDYINAGFKCVVGRESKTSPIAFVSNRRYRLRSHTGLLRFGITNAFDRLGIRYQHVHPDCAGYCSRDDLVKAGEIARLRIL